MNHLTRPRLLVITVLFVAVSGLTYALAQGAAGKAETKKTWLVQREVTAPAQDSTGIQALTCTDGIAVSGGAEWLGGEAPVGQSAIMESFPGTKRDAPIGEIPATAPASDTWTLDIYNGQEDPRELVLYAVCQKP